MFLPRASPIKIRFALGHGLPHLEVESVVLNYLPSRKYLLLGAHDDDLYDVFVNIIHPMGAKQKGRIVLADNLPELDTIELHWCELQLALVSRSSAGDFTDLRSEYRQLTIEEAANYRHDTRPSLSVINFMFSPELTVDSEMMEWIKGKLK